MAKKVNKKRSSRSARQREAMGLGLKAVIGKIAATAEEGQEELVKELTNTVAHIPISQIEVNPFQPRNEFDEESLLELTTSIQTHGLIQPLTVRRLTDNQYQLISGERRLRAAQRADLKEVPAYIRLANDQEMLEMALVENIQRRDLNAIEVAISYQRLIEECKLTHEDMSKRVGKNRTTITNHLRLLKLPPTIQQGVKEGLIAMGHARALAGVEDIILKNSLYNQTVEEQLSVRALEKLIRSFGQPKEIRAASATLPTAYLSIQDTLRNRFETKVSLKRNAKGNGQIVIPFKDDRDLNRLLELLEEE